MNNWSFRHQIIFISLAPALLTWVTLTLNTVYTSWDTLSRSYTHHGKMLAQQIAPSCEFALFSGDMEPLNTLLTRSLTETDILTIEIYDSHYHLLSRIGDPPPQHSETVQQLTFSAPIYSSIIDLERTDIGEQHGEYLGSVSITLSPDSIIKARETIIEQALWLGGIVLILTASLALFLTYRFTLIFSALRSAMSKIAHGDFSPPREELPAKGELGDLSHDLHRMAAALERNRKEAIAAYEELELRALEAEQMVTDQNLHQGNRR